MPLALRTQDIALSSYDRDCLDGRWGSATARAMQFVVQTAKALQARRLIDVNHCHLVGPYYSGEADLTFLRRLVEDGARIRVPTTLNASSACRLFGKATVSETRYEAGHSRHADQFP